MKAKILLADDDEEVLAALNAVLQSEGYEVIVAKDGREAIERFHQGHVDIALLDLNMPVKGGWETFGRLTTIHPLLPVIVITARPDQYPLAVAAGVGALMEKTPRSPAPAASDRGSPARTALRTVRHGKPESSRSRDFYAPTWIRTTKSVANPPANELLLTPPLRAEG